MRKNVIGPRSGCVRRKASMTSGRSLATPPARASTPAASAIVMATGAAKSPMRAPAVLAVNPATLRRFALSLRSQASRALLAATGPSIQRPRHAPAARHGAGLVGQTIEQAAGHPRMQPTSLNAKVKSPSVDDLHVPDRRHPSACAGRERPLSNMASLHAQRRTATPGKVTDPPGLAGRTLEVWTWPPCCSRCSRSSPAH
jgi:hypothetical protein